MSKYRAIVDDEESIFPSNSSQSNSLSIGPSTPLLSDSNADEVQVEIEDEPGTASSASCVVSFLSHEYVAELKKINCGEFSDETDGQVGVDR